MKYFGPINFPKFNSITTVKESTSVKYLYTKSIFSQIGIETEHPLDDVQCLEAWIMPYSALEIHKDLDYNSKPALVWSLVCVPNGHDGCMVEIYEQAPTTKVHTMSSVSGYNMTSLDKDTAILAEVWDMKNGACIFDAGSLWHTVRNITNAPVNILSFRSKKIESLDKLRVILETKI